MSFRRATDALLEEINPNGGWNAVNNITKKQYFKPLFLVQSKKKILPWGKRNFYVTHYKLEDVLLSKDQLPQIVVEELKPFHIEYKMSRKGKGKLAADPNVASVNVRASASESHDCTMTVKTRHINPYELLEQRREVNMDHEFIKHWKKSSNDLYVVTAAVELLEMSSCRESTGQKGGCCVGTDIVPKIGISVGLQGEVQNSKEIGIPVGTVLAFKVCELRFKERYFEPLILLTGIRKQLNGEDLRTLGIIEDKRKDLQGEIERECAELFLLPANLCGKFLAGFMAIMRENNLLQELALQLEQALEGTVQFKLKSDKPEVQDLLKNFQDSSGAIDSRLVNAINYFLQALLELTEFQLQLIVKSVEKKIVSKQRALVESILDQDFSKEEMDFTVDAQLVSLFSEEELNLTGVMIESSGVTMRKDEPGLAGTGDPNAFSALSSLYVALHILAWFQRDA